MDTPPFPNKKYSIIYADPPWSYEVYDEITGSGRSATQHYDTMSWEDLFNLPVADIAADNCALFIWTVTPSLPNCLKVIERWGFRYINKAFCWNKLTVTEKDYFGLGFYTRGNTEDCYLGVKGEMYREDASIRQLQRFPITVEAINEKHSHKPQGFRDEIVKLFDNDRQFRNKIELFSRPPFDNRFDQWGDFGFIAKEDV